MSRALCIVTARVFGALLLVLALSAGIATSARANPDLDRGKALAQDLDLVPALAAFDAAIESGTLTRDELVSLLDERIMVLYGLRKKSELQDDLVWLSALAPDHRLDMRAPPELIAMWTTVRDQGRGPLALTLSANVENGMLNARVETTGTVPSGLDTRLFVRDGLRAFQRTDAATLRESARSGARYGLYAEAVGLAGVVVAQAYSAAEPLEVAAAKAVAVVPSTPPPPPESWAHKHRGWLIGGAVVLIAAVTVTTVVLVKNAQDDHSKDTTLMPMVDF